LALQLQKRGTILGFVPLSNLYHVEMTYFTIILILIILFCVFLYNNLISKKNKVEESYSSIDVMLKKRTDLIPQLINTVKGAIQHERETLMELTQLREKILAKDIQPEERFQLESQLGIMLGKLQVRAEAYPDLKANQNFLLLQSSLNEVEEQLSAARRAYNAAVNSFNNAIEMFPSNIMGKLMRYSKRPLFTIKEEERSVPKISFN
tara:strand:+ start:2041 stop:2661 length:621 start_codon:yes stop_codon:yes gene_type:complete